MTVFTTTFGRILVLITYILAGYLLVRLGVLPQGSDSTLSKLENNLFIPALVLSTFASDFTPEKISSAWKLLLIGSVICLCSVVVSRFIVRAVSRDEFIQNVYRYGLVFSNFGFMGNVIVSAVFPDVFLEYIIFTLPMWAMIFMWGVPCLLIPKEKGDGGVFSRLRKFLNPMFVAMIIGMIIGLFGVALPDFLSSSIKTLADCMSPISMILTGVIVAMIDIKRVMKAPSIYIITAIRLILLPLLGLLIVYFFSIPRLYAICMVALLSMPLGLNIMVIPSGYGKDTSLPAAAIIISHLLSGLTIPLVFALLMKIVY